MYWESAVGLPPPPMPWPEVCHTCENVKDIRLWNLDAVHASIRHLAKEGQGFRTEVEDFVYVSPHRAITWDLHEFKVHNAKRRKKVLTEENVMSIALRVEMGHATEHATGVKVEVFSEGHYTVEPFLRRYGRRIREKAEQSSGVAALVTPHALGVHLNGFGVQHAFFAHEPEPGICHVVVLVAGPAGFDGDACLERIEGALLGRGIDGELGCQVGPLRLFVPPGAHRANAALGQLMLCHDGHRLLPVLEDLRAVGAEAYAEWIKLMSGTLLTFGGQALTEDQLETALQRFEQILAYAEQLVADEEQPVADEETAEFYQTWW